MEELLKDLHRLHLVTKDFKHIIEYEPGSWKMFEPSKFVYSYFAFNTFYNFDWKGSIEQKDLITHQMIEIDGKEQQLSESQRFKLMIDLFLKVQVVKIMKYFLKLLA